MTREYAAASGTHEYAESVVNRAPAWVRTAVNRSRIAQGLRPLLAPGAHQAIEAAAATARAAAEAAEGRRVGVWIAAPDGRLVPATPGGKPARSPATWPSSSTSRTATRSGSRGPLLQCRVLIMPAFGTAAAADLGRALDEAVAPAAIGTADELNGKPGWTIRGGGHDGVLLAVAGVPGSRLRAIDTAHGTIVEWVPDLFSGWSRDIVADLEAGHRAVSMQIRAVQRRTVESPYRHSYITRAELEHIAIFGSSGSRPCYPGAAALVFRGTYRDDADELRKQVDALLAECRFRARQAAR